MRNNKKNKSAWIGIGLFTAMALGTSAVGADDEESVEQKITRAMSAAPSDTQENNNE